MQLSYGYPLQFSMAVTHSPACYTPARSCYIPFPLLTLLDPPCPAPLDGDREQRALPWPNHRSRNAVASRVGTEVPLK